MSTPTFIPLGLRGISSCGRGKSVFRVVVHLSFLASVFEMSLDGERGPWILWHHFFKTYRILWPKQLVLIRCDFFMGHSFIWTHVLVGIEVFLPCVLISGSFWKSGSKRWGMNFKLLSCYSFGNPRMILNTAKYKLYLDQNSWF